MAGISANTSKVRTAFIMYLTYLYACEFNVLREQVSDRPARTPCAVLAVASDDGLRVFAVSVCPVAGHGFQNTLCLAVLYF